MSEPGCPSCGVPGRLIHPATLRGVLTDRAWSCSDASQSFRFCATADCSVVYYGRGIRLGSEDVRVAVFQKSSDPARLVCYCFGHTVGDVEADARRHGKSTIADDITAKCRAALGRCEQANPQGTCCLGNVRGVADAALGETRTDQDAVGGGHCKCGE